MPFSDQMLIGINDAVWFHKATNNARIISEGQKFIGRVIIQIYISFVFIFKFTHKCHYNAVPFVVILHTTLR